MHNPDGMSVSDSRSRRQNHAPPELFGASSDVASEPALATPHADCETDKAVPVSRQYPYASGGEVVTVKRPWFSFVRDAAMDVRTWRCWIQRDGFRGTNAD